MLIYYGPMICDGDHERHTMRYGSCEFPQKYCVIDFKRRAVQNCNKSMAHDVAWNMENWKPII